MLYIILSIITINFHAVGVQFPKLIVFPSLSLKQAIIMNLHISIYQNQIFSKNHIKALPKINKFNEDTLILISLESLQTLNEIHLIFILKLNQFQQIMNRKSVHCVKRLKSHNILRNHTRFYSRAPTDSKKISLMKSFFLDYLLFNLFFSHRGLSQDLTSQRSNNLATGIKIHKLCVYIFNSQHSATRHPLIIFIHLLIHSFM